MIVPFTNWPAVLGFRAVLLAGHLFARRRGRASGAHLVLPLDGAPGRSAAPGP
ncbi:hypothetical protein [Kocuria sp. NPDC057446]|uniref:hypothetical protein n=1 Tax=Kocuria sp. NPDC057446 TaxID=3346137 RepID=UPI0036B9B23E